MKTRPLGRTGLRVSEIGFGAWGLSGVQWIGAREDESVRALHRALDLGVNLIDTALAYGDGTSERIVGRALQRAGGVGGASVLVATKVPPKNRIWPATGSGGRGLPGRARHAPPARRACATSAATTWSCCSSTSGTTGSWTRTAGRTRSWA